jgi:outer membrane murein-binding lipoprotein Lpp
MLDQIVSGPIQTIATTGLLGAIVTLLGVGLVYLMRQNRGLQEARVVDWQTMGKITENNTLASEARTRAQEASTRVTEIQAQAAQLSIQQQTQVSVKIDSLSVKIDNIRDDMQRVREAILQSGGKL